MESTSSRTLLSGRPGWVKALLAVLCLYPIAYMMAFFAFIVSTFAANEPAVGPEVILPLHLSAMVLIVVVLILFCVDLYRRPDVTGDKQTFWLLVLLLGNMIAAPIYWWMYVRPTDSRISAT